MVDAVRFLSMKNSHIEWCDHTFNPWEGCTKVSPGCAHCYAEARNRRFSAGANWGPGAPRRRTSIHNWNEPQRWNTAAAPFFYGGDRPKREADAFGWRPHKPRVFCASLADWLDEEVPIEWLADLLELIGKTQNLDWLLLTKRPQNWSERMHAAFRAGFDGDEWVSQWLDGELPLNVWIGTTVEDQKRADERIPELLKIPARVRFLSCEPLLEKVDLSNHSPSREHGAWAKGDINWIICGGESGPNARPMHPAWARSLRDQCAAAGVAFFFKQWGEWLPGCQYRAGDKERLREKAQHSFDRGNHSWWVGKVAAGRLLDGKEHSEFPDLSARISQG
jgi:protein gp37